MFFTVKSIGLELWPFIFDSYIDLFFVALSIYVKSMYMFSSVLNVHNTGKHVLEAK